MIAASWLTRLRALVARAGELGRRRRINAELDEEMRLHVELATEYNIRQGMLPAEARRSAMASFGGMQRFKEIAGEARGFVAVDRLVRDFRFALRRLWRAPLFAAGAIATIAIGAGFAIGVGTIVYDVLLRPLPYDHPETLARVLVRTPGLGTSTTESSGGVFVYLNEQARSFSALGTYYQSEGVTITEGDRPERITAAMISPSTLRIVGVRPAAGRLLRDDDATASPVPVMISYDVWVRRFGADTSVAGTTIELNRSRRTIVGVLPQGFDFPSASVGIWYPEGVSATRAGLTFRYFSIIGRLRPGVTVPAAQAELARLVPGLSERFPETTPEAVRASGLALSVETLKDATLQPVRAELTLLGVLVIAVLLIATTNVATLVLLRAERLRGEVAVSKALGASRTALVQRFVTEGLVLGAAAGVVAMPLVSTMVSTRFGFSLGQIPRLHEVVLRPGVFIALWALLAAVGAVLGLVGAARASGGTIGWQLRGSHASRDRTWQRVQRSLVITQVASALALLLASVLTGQSLWHLTQVDVGFAAQPATTFEVVLPFQPYPRFADGAAFHTAVANGLAGIGGARGVTAAMSLPFDADVAGMRRQVSAVVGGVVRPATARPNIVLPNYFATMGIPMRAGRTFARGDLQAASPAVVISASLAHELFGNADPIGRDIRVPDSMDFPPYRVVGVVGDILGERIQDGVMPTLYFPLLSEGFATSAQLATPEKPVIPYNPSTMFFVVRTDAAAATLLPAIRAVVAAVDPKVPVAHVSSLADITRGATARFRLTILLLSVAAAAALLLCAIGLYSVIAYAVAGRGREFAIRLALGATPDAVVRTVLKEGAVLVGAGVVAGVSIALFSSQLLRGVLFQVSATNAISYVAAALAVVGVTSLAAYVPARHAGRTDPARVLRSE